MPTAEQLPRLGAAIRRLRLAAGLSLADLARRVHYSKSYLSKVETGQKVPSLDLARRCDVALGADGTLVALVPTTPEVVPSLPMGSQDHQWMLTVDSAGRGQLDVVARDESGLASATGSLSWAMTPAAMRGRDAKSELDVFRTMLGELRRLGQAVPPAALLPILVGHIHGLRLLATTAGAPTRHTAMLLASRYAEFTGWMAQEADDTRGAVWWTDQAVEFAAAGGDRELAAYAFVRHGLIAMYRHDAHETVAAARRAQAGRNSPRIRGLAALREAQGHALAGSYDRCRRALDRGAVLLDSVSDDGQPVLGSTTIRDPVGMATGWCMYDLGRSRQAVSILEQELASIPEYAHRMRARVGVRYGLALIAAGELEQGCVVVDRLLDLVTMTDSATVRIDLRRVAHDVARRHKSRAAQDLMPRLISALRAPYR